MNFIVELLIYLFFDLLVGFFIFAYEQIVILFKKISQWFIHFLDKTTRTEPPKESSPTEKPIKESLYLDNHSTEAPKGIATKKEKTNWIQIIKEIVELLVEIKEVLMEKQTLIYLSVGAFIIFIGAKFSTIFALLFWGSILTLAITDWRRKSKLKKKLNESLSDDSQE